MKNVWKELKQPFFVLAPMDDVTDTVFRQIVADCSAPDLYFTEFVSVDGLQSRGRDALMNKLQFTDKEKPLIAQIWGLRPENYQKSAKQLVKMGFDGIDINMGCPDKTVVKNGCCSALINNRELAKDIVAATKEGANGRLPVSVKTRIGFNEIDLSWPEFLLRQELDALTIHGRTTKEMSKVPNHWDVINEIRVMRDEISPNTILIGNGDIKSFKEGTNLAKKHQLDGVMIGRGVFHDPFVFNSKSLWSGYSPQEKTALYKKQIQLFIKTWSNTKNPATLKKFAKIYINGFDGASNFRSELMQCSDAESMIDVIDSTLKGLQHLET